MTAAQHGMQRIVMANRRHPAQQVLQPAPQQARGLGHAPVLLDGRFFGPVDVPRPGLRIRVGATPQAGIKTEFQVIVGVNQARQDQVSGEVQQGQAGVSRPGRGARLPERMDSARAEFHVQRCGAVGAERHACPAQNP